jgi:hypothetical protein
MVGEDMRRIVRDADGEKRVRLSERGRGRGGELRVVFEGVQFIF